MCFFPDTNKREMEQNRVGEEEERNNHSIDVQSQYVIIPVIEDIIDEVYDVELMGEFYTRRIKCPIGGQMSIK